VNRKKPTKAGENEKARGGVEERRRLFNQRASVLKLGQDYSGSATDI